MASNSPSEPPAKPRNFPYLAKILNGGFAGIVAITCVYPLDLVKTRLQSQPIGPDGQKMYKSMTDCFRKTYRADGFRGLYRGMGINLILITPEKSLKMVANDVALHHLSDQHGKISLGRQMLAGAFAGVVQTVLTTPMELLKIQLQDLGRHASEAKLAGRTEAPVSVPGLIRALCRDKGIAGMFQGQTATMSRTGFFSSIYFPMFTYLNKFGPRREGHPDEATFVVSFLAGCTAAAACSTICNPIDVIKTRMQSVRPGEKAYDGMFDCARKILRSDGPLVFFTGNMCRTIVNAPMFGFIQMVYYLGVAEYLMGQRKL